MMCGNFKKGFLSSREADPVGLWSCHLMLFGAVKLILLSVSHLELFASVLLFILYLNTVGFLMHLFSWTYFLFQLSGKQTPNILKLLFSPLIHGVCNCSKMTG